jgi:plasmid stability protein
MPSLQVRELPEHIYRTLRKEAEEQHRSIAQQAIAALARGLDLELDPKMRRKCILEAIKSEVIRQGKTALPDPALLIREERDR